MSVLVTDLFAMEKGEGGSSVEVSDDTQKCTMGVVLGYG